ncbi:MAG TPA: membrane protein insertase YidC [Candidatus Limnocylindrales bacterium]|nr:membrane protein insertase YidC [Candidatus Limnocylindrales bacterium]
METRLVLALALSLAILVGFQLLVPAPPPAPDAQQTTSASSPEAPNAVSDVAASGAPEPAADAAAPPGPTLEVRTDLYRAVFVSRGGRLTSFELNKYPATADPESGPYDLIHADGAKPLAVVWRSATGGVVDDRAIAYELKSTATEVGPGQTATVTMVGRTASGGTVSKTLELRGGSYLLGYTVEAKGLGATPIGVSWSRGLTADSSQAANEGPVAYVDMDLQFFAANGLTEPAVLEGRFSWAGYAEHYFLAAYVPEEPVPAKLIAATGDGAGQATLWSTAPTERVQYQMYIGPKSMPELEKLGHDLDQAIDLGWFWIIAKPLMWALLLIERVVGNYGWAIILLTIAVRLLFYPVNKRQIEAMKGMQRIQPEIQKIQERFKDDREKLNREMMELYRRHKVNPLAGCLPMLLQLPVFVGLYNVLLQAIELRHAPFFGWIDDLSQPDRLGHLAIPFLSPPGIPVLTLLMGASMIVQQKMTPSTADPTQQRMMLFMPVIFTVMFVNFPAGLVLYWLSNNILSIGQQYLSNRQAS